MAFTPIAQAVALTFQIPLFTTIAAGTVLRKVGIHRWGATPAGFGGARYHSPAVDVSLPILMVVLSSAPSVVERKVLTWTDSAAVTVFWMNLLMLPDSDPAGILLDYAGSGGYPPIVLMALSAGRRIFRRAPSKPLMPAPSCLTIFCDHRSARCSVTCCSQS